MSSWKELDLRFRELIEPLRFTRVDAQWGSAGEHWHLVGLSNKNAEKRFLALTTMAGNKLLEILKPGSEIADELIKENDPIKRWYKGLQKISKNFNYGFVAEEKTENGEHIGYIYTGSIHNVAEASSVFCLELATHYPESNQVMAEQANKENYNKLVTKIWDKYGVPVITTILGGLLLALLLRVVL